MVKSDVGYDAKFRTHYIRAVKPTAESCLKNDDIYSHISEPAEGHHRSDLKERHVKMIESIFPSLDKIPDLFFGNQPCPRPAFIRPLDDSHPFPEIQDMRRGIKSHTKSCRSERRSQHIGHRTFTIGACHMDYFI